MHRDRQREAGFKSSRQSARKEWEPAGERQHQREAREHARQTGKERSTHEVPEAGAKRRILELAARV